LSDIVTFSSYDTILAIGASKNDGKTSETQLTLHWRELEVDRCDREEAIVSVVFIATAE